MNRDHFKEGFRAARHARPGRAVCPYRKGSVEAKTWKEGRQYEEETHSR